MNLNVDSTALQASSRQMRRTDDVVHSAPGAVQQAFGSVAEGCGDPTCASLATSLAGAWRTALGALAGGADGLASTTGSAGTKYADTERIVMHAVGTAR